MILLSELQAKEVVLLATGRRIGFIDDLEIDDKTGNIISLIVLERNVKGSFFAKPTEITIIWNQISTIGDDFILIKANNDSPIIENNDK